MKKLLLVLLWFPTAIITLLFVLGYYSYHQSFKSNFSAENTPKKLAAIPYNFYTSLPKVLGAKSVNTFHIESKNIVPKLIQNYLAKYNSPMQDSYLDLIKSAQKYDIDPLFLIAIAQCESNLGKKMPHKDESDPLSCKNPFGWGIHQGGTLCFDTWQKGYETVAKGLKEKYYDKGYHSTEEIMQKYTPPALEKGGSWAKCVNQFIDQLNEIKNEM